jgi:hypothetical protein
MLLRQSAVALAVTTSLFAQTPAPQTPAAPTPARVDAVVTDGMGLRIRGLTAVDFKIIEDGEERVVEEAIEYSASAAATANKVDDPRYVALVTPATPAPPWRVVVLADESTPVNDFLTLRRANDLVTIDTNASADLTSRIAAAALRLARHPERKGIVVFGEVEDAARNFAARRGIAVIKPDAVEDLTSYYTLKFKSSGGKNLQVRTTRAFNVRSTLSSAPPLSRDAIGDSVLAHHFVAPQSNDLGIAARASAATLVDTKRQVKLQVLVPVRSLTLTKEGEEVVGGFDVLTSIGDGKGRFTRVNQQSHTIRWPASAAAPDKAINYTFDVVLEPGSTRISVGVVDQNSKKTGFQRVEVSE